MQKPSASRQRLIKSVDIMDIARSTNDGRRAGQGIDPVSVAIIAGASAGGGLKLTRAATRALTQHAIVGGIAPHGQGRTVARLVTPRALVQAAWLHQAPVHQMRCERRSGLCYSPSSHHDLLEMRQWAGLQWVVALPSVSPTGPYTSDAILCATPHKLLAVNVLATRLSLHLEQNCSTLRPRLQHKLPATTRTTSACIPTGQVSQD